MTDEDRVRVAVCSGDLQARLLISQLAARGIVAQSTMVDGGGPLRGHRVEVRVPVHQAEEAKSIAADLSGSSGLGLLDMRRLLPALLVLIGMVLIIVAVVRLVT